MILEQTPEYWDQLLASEWNWDIDLIEWFSAETSTKISSLLDISDLEEKHNIKIHIDREYNWVTLFDNKGTLIWYFKNGHYTYWNIDHSEHIEKVVFEEFRWKWYAQILFDIYKNIFWLPKTEVWHDKSSILFLLKNWYKIVWYYDDNWDFVEFNDVQSIQSEYDLRNNENIYVPAYKLSL